MVRMCKPPDICCDDKRRQGLACVLEVLVRDHELRMSRGDGPGPVTVGCRLCRVSPLSYTQDVPGKIAVRICGSVGWNAAGETAIVFENEGGKRRSHTVGMLNEQCDRVVRQIPLKGGFPVIL